MKNGSTLPANDLSVQPRTPLSLFGRAVAFFLVLTGLILPLVPARADEMLGHVELSDFLVAPFYTYHERQRGAFDPGNSYISGSWIRDNLISGTVTLGTRELLGVPTRYGIQPNPQDLAIVEAYAQVDSSYGRVQFGLVKIPFGAEGGVPEGLLHFQRSLLYQAGVIGLRDQGLNYAIENGGFFSEWALHNGEGGQDKDNQIWLTGRVGYHLSLPWRVGVSWQVGRTHVTSTHADSTMTPTPRYLAFMNVDKSSKVRIGDIYTVYQSPKIAASAELTEGQVEQDGGNTNFYAGHADVYVPLNPILAALARVDTLAANAGDQSVTREATLGVSFRTGFETSEVFIYGSQLFHPGKVSGSSEFMAVWRLTPFVTYHQ